MTTKVTLKDSIFEVNLTDTQIKNIKKSYKESSYKFLDDIFGKDNFRLSFEVMIDQQSNLTDDDMYGSNQDYISVKEFVNKHEYIITDYSKGICKLKDDKREFKIGRVLSRYDASDEIKKHFENGKSRESAKLSKYPMMITISRNPYDVAAMSTKRGWSSCMDLNNGCNQHYVMRDIANGTCIAYLHSPGDKDILNPTCRILLKKFTKNKSRKNKDKVLRIERSMYGSSNNILRDFVSKWCADTFTLEEDCELKMSDVLYNDGIGHQLVYVSNNSKLISSEDKKDRIKAAKFGSDVVRKKLINDKEVDVIQTVLSYTKDKELLIDCMLKQPENILKNIIHEKWDYFNILNKSHKDFMINFIKNNMDRKYTRPFIKHFQKSETYINSLLENDFDGLVDIVCRHGNNDIVNSMFVTHPSFFNQVEIAKRVPKQLTVENLKSVIDNTTDIGRFLIYKNDKLDSVSYKINNKTPKEYIVDMFPTTKEMLENKDYDFEKLNKDFLDHKIK